MRTCEIRRKPKKGIMPPSLKEYLKENGPLCGKPLVRSECGNYWYCHSCETALRDLNGQ